MIGDDIGEAALGTAGDGAGPAAAGTAAPPPGGPGPGGGDGDPLPGAQSPGGSLRLPDLRRGGGPAADGQPPDRMFKI